MSTIIRTFSFAFPILRVKSNGISRTRRHVSYKVTIDKEEKANKLILSINLKLNLIYRPDNSVNLLTEETYRVDFNGAF